MTIKMLVVAVSLASAPQAFAGFVQPADARGIRTIFGDTFLLGFLAVKKDPGFFEDRTILEFPLGPFGATVPQTTLEFSLRNLDPGLPPGVLDVFTFVADGVVVPNDFFAGGAEPIIQLETFFVTLHASIDVTSQIQSLVDAGESFIGFRLSTETLDRYNVGPTAGFPIPQLNVVPEPTTLLLLPAAATLLARRKRKRR